MAVYTRGDTDAKEAATRAAAQRAQTFASIRGRSSDLGKYLPNPEKLVPAVSTLITNLEALRAEAATDEDGGRGGSKGAKGKEERKYEKEIKELIAILKRCEAVPELREHKAYEAIRDIAIAGGPKSRDAFSVLVEDQKFEFVASVAGTDCQLSHDATMALVTAGQTKLLTELAKKDSQLALSALEEMLPSIVKNRESKRESLGNDEVEALMTVLAKGSEKAKLTALAVLAVFGKFAEIAIAAPDFPPAIRMLEENSKVLVRKSVIPALEVLLESGSDSAKEISFLELLDCKLFDKLLEAEKRASNPAREMMRTRLERRITAAATGLNDVDTVMFFARSNSRFSKLARDELAEKLLALVASTNSAALEFLAEVGDRKTRRDALSGLIELGETDAIIRLMKNEKISGKVIKELQEMLPELVKQKNVPVLIALVENGSVRSSIPYHVFGKEVKGFTPAFLELEKMIPELKEKGDLKAITYLANLELEIARFAAEKKMTKAEKKKAAKAMVTHAGSGTAKSVRQRKEKLPKVSEPPTAARQALEEMVLGIIEKNGLKAMKEEAEKVSEPNAKLKEVMEKEILPALVSVGMNGSERAQTKVVHALNALDRVEEIKQLELHGGATAQAEAGYVLKVRELTKGLDAKFTPPDETRGRSRGE
ncbi:MAG: hypothetical protein NT157_00845 [Candidatus Micrarchaeota archaeon]|nr:hypothetical protein [Candidatus Micrarchaeota archaeon]